MDDDPFLGWGLRPVDLADRATLDPFFASLSQPLSDYTFSQLFTWRNSLRIAWKIIQGHLCVFANGSGDLTLLMPPIGDTGGDRALAEAVAMMDQYNVAHAVPERTRVEYASEELLARFDAASVEVAPMGADYVYDTQRMIDLAGGDLSSKRQAKNRFVRLYPHRVETYRVSDHQADCLALLEQWKQHQDEQHGDQTTLNAVKRNKESTATALSLHHAEALGLSGRVVYVRPDPQAPWALAAFTFGEPLGAEQSSITIEKTDLQIKGLAQFIFSEFCRLDWSDRPLVNVGDDWGMETLAWTKLSYRPVQQLKKFALRPARRRATLSTAFNIEIPPPRSTASVPNRAPANLPVGSRRTG